jgi:hypothetical protein
MKTSWQHSPGSKQHWLHHGSSYTGSIAILGMVYEANPTAFIVYRENHKNPTTWHTRTFLAEMPTLDEAKDLLQTVVGSQL